jgi:alpha-1,3-rhamnosyl/mannosyltransferase
MSPDGLRVVINDRPLRQPRTGVGQYVYQLLRSLRTMAPQLDVTPFYFHYFRRSEPTETGPMPVGAGPIQGSRKPWFVRQALQAVYEAGFNAITLASGYDVYHEPNHIPMRWAGPTVTTVHDLSVIRHPEWHPADRVKWYEAEFERTLSQTTEFVAVSKFTAGEMARVLGVPPERITVCYQAPRAPFYPRPSTESRAVLARLRIEPPFLLFVGTLEPRKNLPRMLEAYARMPVRLRRRYPLVIAGGLGWGFDELLAPLRVSDIRDSIRLTGFVSDHDLACLYTTCRALIWPSLYEGFGLPPLECMACGRPVVVSNVASLPEVVGEAGLRVNPEDVEAIAVAMAWVADDDALAARLALRGVERAATFTWEAFAGQHVRVYTRAAG